MTITVERKSETIKKIELNVPAYFDYGTSFFKILNANQYLEVESDGDDYGIRVQDSAGIVALVAESGQKISEEEFNKQYQKVFNSLRVML